MQPKRKLEDSSIMDYSLRTDPDNQPKTPKQANTPILNNGRVQTWDPKIMLNNLSFLEQKIHRLQELVHMIVGQNNQVPNNNQDEVFTQQQQLITADLTSIIVQLISTAGCLLPSVNPSPMQLNGVLFPSPPNNVGQPQQTQTVTDVKSHQTELSKPVDIPANSAVEINSNLMEEDHDSKDDDEGKEEHLPPGSYEILQLEKEEILAPHTHFCPICGKGFKRDANLRMHMRGHGDEYKTPAALAKPNKESSPSEKVLLKRYSCPFVGCKRNKDHKKFQPLKTILCVKNHYKRTHCDKSYICSRCHTKKFSVMADLKTHEKHCGRDKWLCSCGTTFSRKDKLFGHIALFQGHTPAIPLEDSKSTPGSSSNPPENEPVTTNKAADVGFGGGFGSDSVSVDGIDGLIDVKGNVEDPYLSLLNYECSLSGLQDFPPANYDDTSSSFSFLIGGEKESSAVSGVNTSF